MLLWTNPILIYFFFDKAERVPPGFQTNIFQTKLPNLYTNKLVSTVQKRCAQSEKPERNHQLEKRNSNRVRIGVPCTWHQLYIEVIHLSLSTASQLFCTCRTRRLLISTQRKVGFCFWEIDTMTQEGYQRENHGIGVQSTCPTLCPEVTLLLWDLQATSCFICGWGSSEYFLKQFGFSFVVGQIPSSPDTIAAVIGPEILIRLGITVFCTNSWTNLQTTSSLWEGEGVAVSWGPMYQPHPVQIQITTCIGALGAVMGHI